MNLMMREEKIIKGLKEHKINYVKKFYSKYKKEIKKSLKGEEDLENKMYNIIGKTIVKLKDYDEVEELLRQSIESIKILENYVGTFECIEDVQKYVLRKWLLEDEEVEIAWVFNRRITNSADNLIGSTIYFDAIAIKKNIISINQYTRLFEIFYSSDYELPYSSNIHNIDKVTGRGGSTMTITFKDGFRFSALPLDLEDREAIKEIRKLIS